MNNRPGGERMKRFQPTPENLEKLRISREEVEGMESQKILCGYCGRCIAYGYGDRAGHIAIMCHNCKQAAPINLGLFRTMRKRTRLGMFKKNATRGRMIR